MRFLRFFIRKTKLCGKKERGCCGNRPHWEGQTKPNRDRDVGDREEGEIVIKSRYRDYTYSTPIIV